MSSLVLTLKETLRYRGALGQWSWVLHRLSGLGVLLFFTIHIVDTSWSVFYPTLYEKAISAYQTPLFTLGEFALVAAVVYHAYNGLRIVILDFKPQWWPHQQKAAVWVLLASVVTLIPVFLLMFTHILTYYDEGAEMLTVGEVITEQIPFVTGIVLAFVAALVLSALSGLVVGNTDKPKTGKAHGSRVERFWWSYMRISGLLIIPLVFGHLAMMHIVQGVFDITVAGKAIVGVTATDGTLLTNAINDSGTAVEFVGERWNYLLASVAVWRFYDFALLVLAGLHGFNGLRYVLTDYTMSSPILRRAAVYVCVIGAVVTTVVGGAALIGTIEETAVETAIEARAELGLERQEEGFQSQLLPISSEGGNGDEEADTVAPEATDEADGE